MDVFQRVSEGRITLSELEQGCWEAYRRFLPEPVFPKVMDFLLLTPDVSHDDSLYQRQGSHRLHHGSDIAGARGSSGSHHRRLFLVTNRHRRDIGYLVGEKANPAVVDMLSGVGASYLEASFAAMEETWGSTDGYLSGALGLTDERRRRLQDILLECAAET